VRHRMRYNAQESAEFDNLSGMTQRSIGQTVNELPEVLSHYTSMDGLRGIVTDKKIWASHVRYLNDRTEQEHIWSLILERVQQRILATSDAQAKNNLALFQDEIKKGGRDEAYVASFSAEGDYEKVTFG
jgi:hypothetical protein